MFTPSPSTTPKSKLRLDDHYRTLLSKNNTTKKTTTYTQVFKKKIDFEKNNKLPLGYKLLNRSVEKYSSMRKSREGSVEGKMVVGRGSREGSKERRGNSTRIHNMEIESNILNISINSLGSNQNDRFEYYGDGDSIGNQEKYPDQDFIKVEDFIVKEDQQEKNRLNKEYQEMVGEIERIKEEEEKEQGKLKTVDKNIKEKKKIVTNQKKPGKEKEGLGGIQHQLQKEKTRLDQVFRKTRETLDKNTMKLRIQLQGVKQKWQNLNQKQMYLISIRKQQQHRQIEQNKQAAHYQKQKKQQAIILTQFKQVKQQSKKLQSKINKIRQVQLPSLDIHRKYISMLERYFIEKEIEKIDNYLIGKRSHAELKRKGSKLKDDITMTKGELEQAKKKLEVQNKKMNKLKDQMVEKSRIFLELTQQDQHLDSVRMSK